LVGGITDNPSTEQDTMITTRYAALALIASAVAACSNEPTAPKMAATPAPAFSTVASPNTPVNSNFVIYVGGTTYYAGSGPSRNGKGQCRTHSDGTVGWYWVPGNYTAGGSNGRGGGASGGDQEVGPNHEQCRFVSGGYTVTVNFNEVATYVKSPSGNFALNFDPYCVPNADQSLPPTCYSRYVHYQFTKDSTQGDGVLHGIGVRSDNQSTSHWSIDLSQIHSSSNLIGDPPRSLLVIAHCDDGTYPDSPATVSW
jgi:hypothetical protein